MIGKVFVLLFPAALMLMVSPAVDNPTSAGKAAIVVSGDLPKTGALGLDELNALGTTDIAWSPDKESHHFRGVSLEKVLVHFGFAPGTEAPGTPKPEKLSGWRKVVVASSSDGFQAVFTCAEIAEAMGPSRVYLAWEMDGKPLSEESGPLRVIVTTDKDKGRCIYQVNRLDIVDLKRVVAPGSSGNVSP